MVAVQRRYRPRRYWNRRILAPGIASSGPAFFTPLQRAKVTSQFSPTISTFDRPTASFNLPHAESLCRNEVVVRKKVASLVACANAFCSTSTHAEMPPRTISLGTVLVVGGCGFLGSHIVDQLLNFPSEDYLPSSTNSVPIGTTAPTSSSLSTLSQSNPATWSFPSLRTRYPSYTKTSVHVLDLRCSRNRLPGATYHEGDITDPSSLLTVFRAVKPDLVINSASGMYDAPKHILQKVNIEGTRC